MGNFDILLYKIKCPKCKKQREWKIQFKTLVDDNVRDLEDYPKYFNVDDTIIIKYRFIFGIGNCPICMTQKDILIKIKNNKISKEYEFDNRSFKEVIKNVY